MFVDQPLASPRSAIRIIKELQFTLNIMCSLNILVYMFSGTFYMLLLNKMGKNLLVHPSMLILFDELCSNPSILLFVYPDKGWRRKNKAA